MKTTIDDKLIPARVWYYLLDWNESDMRTTIYDMFKEHRLCDLTRDQLLTLYVHATNCDKETIANQ